MSAYSAIFALGMALTTWHELAMAQGRAPLELIDAIIFNAQAVAVASAGFAAIVETEDTSCFWQRISSKKNATWRAKRGVKRDMKRGKTRPTKTPTSRS